MDVMMWKKLALGWLAHKKFGPAEVGIYPFINNYLSLKLLNAQASMLLLTIPGRIIVFMKKGPENNWDQVRNHLVITDDQIVNPRFDPIVIFNELYGNIENV